MSTRALVIALSVLTPGIAAAQLVTPPPLKAPSPADLIKLVRPPALEIARGREFRDPMPQQQVPAGVSLIQRDGAGNLIRLKEPAEYAALRKNPLIAGDDLA